MMSIMNKVEAKTSVTYAVFLLAAILVEFDICLMLINSAPAAAVDLTKRFKSVGPGYRSLISSQLWQSRTVQ